MSLKTFIGGVVTGLPGAVLGLKKDQQAVTDKEKEALANVRKKFPGPATCSTGTEKLPVYRGNGQWDDSGTVCKSACDYVTNAIYDMQKALDDWHIPRNESDYIKAYNIVMGEYKQYYQNTCMAAAPTGDHVLDSAVVPNGGMGGTTGGPATGNVQPAPAPAPASSGVGSAIKTAANKQLIKGVPNWVLWVAGAIVAGTLIYVIAKPSKGVSTAS